MAVIAGSHLYTVYTYRRFRDHPAVCGLTGTQVARLLLDKVGLSQVEVKEVQGLLADGYEIIHKFETGMGMVYVMGHYGIPPLKSTERQN
mgnify:CR=1 FL=1